MSELLQIINDNAVLWYGVVAFVSLLVGSFLNVVIHRLPIMMESAWRESLAELQEADAEAALARGSGNKTENGSASLTAEAEIRKEPFTLSRPRSRCPNCGSLIHWYQNIPVLSWLMLRGKCAECSAPISIRYPLVELATMFLSLIVAWHFGPSAQALLGIIVTWFLIALTMIDFDTQYLPDSLTLPLMWIGLVASLVPVFVDAPTAIIGAAAGYLSLWSVYHLFRLLTGKEGMGYGDFKLLAALGALLGWQQLPMIIMLSSLVGALFGIAMIVLRGRDRNIPMPFGPFLAAAGFLAMLWGEQLSRAWFGTF